MSKQLYLIVEGDGESTAAPKLIRRILQEYLQQHDVLVSEKKTYNAKGNGNLTTPNGLERFLNLVRKQKDCAAVLVLLDAEKENVQQPEQFSLELAERARKVGLHFPAAIAVAVCEYESWFLLNVERIAPEYFRPDAEQIYPGDAEAECSAKGWLNRQFPKGKKYLETIHQEKMTFKIDIPHTMENSPSFRRLVMTLEALIRAIHEEQKIVLPPL